MSMATQAVISRFQYQSQSGEKRLQRYSLIAKPSIITLSRKLWRNRR
jgi:hypothetical protein